MTEITSAPMIACRNDATVKPLMTCATNQKNRPLIMIEKSPRVRIFNGSVSKVITGLTIIFKNTKQAATIIAVRILLTVMPATKYGRAKIARVVMNQRSNIIAIIIAELTLMAQIKKDFLLLSLLGCHRQSLPLLS
jgi:hypothetical protein